MRDELDKVFALSPSGLAYDSRQVKPGFVFFAIKGFVQDGHNYVADAVRRGAVGVVAEKAVEVPAGVLLVKVPDTRLALALAAARFYGYPGQRLRLVGVTGTNGKTTTTHLISALYQARGEKVGLIGTLYAKIGDLFIPEERTTPESLNLQALLCRMAEKGATTVVMEVSSHALALKRVAGLEFDVAIFTNLTQDHLDFHRDAEDYFKAKAALFTQFLKPGLKARPKLSVLNIDDPYGVRLSAVSNGRIIKYGVDGVADVRARDIVLTGAGTRYVAEGSWGQVPVRLKLVGRFNVYNSLAAFAVGLGEGFPPEEMARVLENVSVVPGRFEQVDMGQDFTVVVDYAHTPDGLENVLRAARALTRERVIVVFGCGGDRDPTKRPVMGELAGKLADFTVVTSDNPRSEEPLAIINAIEAGLRRVTRHESYVVEPDRRQAIAAALQRARTGDVVVIAGKGHEDYQIIGEAKLPFDDRKIAAAVLRDLVQEKGRGVAHDQHSKGV
ncbi:MAG: UDP-N-acetylmuramoyl-L-alanyl-D-glutamate--2,6-diaminopimelate ligase [Bacillota bacterium]